jgi:carboxylesterase type B
MARSLRSHPNTVKGLVKEYNITPDSADEVAWRGILEFASDIRFYAPVIALGDNWVGESYIYHFNEPNPWEGPWKGEANHLMDVVYLFQNFNEKLSPAQQKRAEQFAEHIVIFVNGKSPYPSRQSNKNGAMVYGGPTGATFVESATAQGFGRRDTIFTFAKTVGLDALNEALIRFLAGK